MKHTTHQIIRKFQSSGQLLRYSVYHIYPVLNCGLFLFLFRLFTTASTLHRVMCGVLVQFCMKYGVWDTNLLRNTPIKRFGVIKMHLYINYNNYSFQCIKLVESGYRLPSPPGCPRSVYQIMIDCWLVIYMCHFNYSIVHVYVHCRHPVAADRPTFESIRTQLSQAKSSSFSQSDDDTLFSLGTTVYVENGCYPELQNKYL